MGPTRQPPVEAPDWNERAAVALLVLVAGHLLAAVPAPPTPDYRAGATPSQAPGAPTPTAIVGVEPSPTSAPRGADMPTQPGAVRLRDLRIIQFREGRDGEPCQLDTADRSMVLRILEADLAWLKDSDHRAP